MHGWKSELRGYVKNGYYFQNIRRNYTILIRTYFFLRISPSLVQYPDDSISLALGLHQHSVAVPKILRFATISVSSTSPTCKICPDGYTATLLGVLAAFFQVHCIYVREGRLPGTISCATFTSPTRYLNSAVQRDILRQVSSCRFYRSSTMYTETC